MVKNDEDMRRVLELFSVEENKYRYIAPWILLNKCMDLKFMVDSIANVLHRYK